MANRHLTGQIRHFTKRTVQRQFLLRPDRGGNVANIVGYSLAFAAERHGLELYAAMLMSNHLHQVGLDTTGDCSDFLRDGHANIALPMNKRLKRRENFFRRGRGGNELLLDSMKVLEKMLYVWTNPVEAGLVTSAKAWKSFKILPDDWGKPMTFTRPPYFTDPTLPAEVTIVPMPPDIFGTMDLEEIRAFCNAALKERELEIRAERRKRRRKKVIGMKKCYDMSPFRTPNKSEPFSKLNPRFSGSDKKEIAIAIAMHKAFELEHSVCWRQLKKGNKTPKFPAGCVRYRKLARKPKRGDPHLPIYLPIVK